MNNVKPGSSYLDLVLAFVLAASRFTTEAAKPATPVAKPLTLLIIRAATDGSFPAAAFSDLQFGPVFSRRRHLL